MKKIALIGLIVISGIGTILVVNDYYTSIKTDNNSKLMEENSDFISSTMEQILINSNSDFKKFNFSGIGTSDNPYRIESLTINSTSGSMIVIQDTTVYVEIRNNKFNGLGEANYAIELNNVSHISIMKNSITNNSLFGILIRFSDNIVISDNLISNNAFGGINIYSSKDILVKKNAIHYNNGYGIWLRDNVEHCEILHNGILGNLKYGLLIGRESDGDNPTSNLNFVNENTFENNNIGFSEQAGNFGEINEFGSNYWNDWIFPDSNLDGWVDQPYSIAGPYNSFDNSPRTSYLYPHLLFPLILLLPNGGESFEDQVNLEWTPPSSPLDFGTIFSVEISKDKLEWKTLVTNLNSTTFVWYTRNFREGEYYIKVIAIRNILRIDTISEQTITIKHSQIILENLIKIFFLLSLTGLATILGFIYYKSKMKSNQFLPNLINTFQPNNLRNLYNKIVIGIENAKIELLGQDLTSELIFDLPGNTALANIYPENLRNEMRSDIRGKSVMILTEIAYQPQNNSHSAFISEILSIPRQTTSDEIKRLVKLEYLQPLVTTKTLLDARYKYYSITKKGILFLHLLKESIRVTLMQVHKEFV